jgi:hydroxymethylglutaryl-CoA synthase
MSNDFGILSFGAYIPQRRLQRTSIYAANAWFAPELKGLSKGERAIGNWDEDAITMAVEAARDALTGWHRASIGGLSLASTTLPFADRLNAGVVKEALNLEDAVSALDNTGSLRAGTSALIQVLKAAAAGASPHLCIAADMRKAPPASEAELVYGDAAAAMLVGSGKPIAKFLGAHSITVDFVDHFRAAGVDFDYVGESRWIRDEGYMSIAANALKAALKAFGIAGKDIDRCAIAISARGVPEALARKVGVNPEAMVDPLSAHVGDAGAAHPLLMLASAFEQAQPGEKILVAAFGQGLDVLLLEATPALADLPARMGVAKSIARRKPDENYLRYLFHRGALPLDRGMRAEKDEKQPSTTLYRNRKAVFALVGGRCTKTGTVQFPKTEISVDPNDHCIGTQEDYPLAEKHARIATYTADRLTYSPDPPTYYGMLDFEGGGRLTTEFADVDAASVEVGRTMRMVFRIKAVDERRHFKRYFWKAVPIV